MQIYQFIKYDHETTLSHLLKYSETGAVICFDFEDGIYNWICPEKSPSLKQYYRNSFKNIAKNILPQISNLNICVRLNSDPEELQKDMETISNLQIHSILIPKAETPESLSLIEWQLNSSGVIFNEIIPIIETKNGLLNLLKIIKSVPNKINSVGFGHCDYNLSINAFPFFHQNSREYWKWIEYIHANVFPLAIRFINSPFLELENASFYKAILAHLNSMFGEKFGQFTLTTNQSKICNTFKKDVNLDHFSKLVDSRLDLKVPEYYAENLIQGFQNENKNQGFTITIKDNILISPQEYIAAKRYLARKKALPINLTFVGGCFPVQYNILFEDLFHQLLKTKIETEHSVVLNINLIRYERFTACIDKIANYNTTNPIDILIFHIRPEPFLRLVKFYYKYLNSNGKQKYSFNIPALNNLKPEKYDMQILSRRFNNNFRPNNSQFHKALVDLNYRVGNFLGNKKYSMRKYLELVNSVIFYCESSKIFPIILGIPLRANTPIEPTLCRELNEFIQDPIKKANVLYIEALDMCTEKNESLFHSNGMHANEKFHALMAERIYRELKIEIEKIAHTTKINHNKLFL